MSQMPPTAAGHDIPAYLHDSFDPLGDARERAAAALEPSPRAQIVASLLLTLALFAAVATLVATAPQPMSIVIQPPVPTPTITPTPTPAPVTVYVTGAVAEPNTLVTLPHDSRVSDALEGAGGTLPDADLERVNLAAYVRDGDQIHVYRVGAPEIPLATASGAAALSSGVVAVNRATQEELETLPGIGPALAARIIEYRALNGAFADLAALDAVRGIGPALLANLDGLVSFEP